jgi:hypothetical protein
MTAIGGYTKAVSGQRLGKDAPAERNRRATIEILVGTECFYVLRAEEL